MSYINEEIECYDDDFMYDEDTEFEYFREEAHKYAREREDRVMSRWLKELCGDKFDEPIGYHFDRFKSTATIYTTRPGVLIGRGGRGVDILKSILKDEFEFSRDWKVSFVEIRGGFYIPKKCAGDREKER